MPGRKWTPDEEAYLREHYRYGTGRKIARRLDRSHAAVMQKVAALGLQTYRRGQYDPQFLAFIREQHASGLLDTEIAKAWNADHQAEQINRRSLTYLRDKVLGLPVNESSLRRSRRQAYETQLQTLRIDSCGDIAVRHYRRHARRAGWPEFCTPRQVAILNLMADGESRTRREIADAIGHRPKSDRALFKCRGGSRSYLYNLVLEGLLRRTEKRLRRAVGKGKGHSEYEYYMPLDVLMKYRQRQRQRKAG